MTPTPALLQISWFWTVLSLHFGFLPATRHKIVEIALVCLIHLDMLRMSAGNNFTMISNELISTALMMGRLWEDVYQFIVRPFDHAQPTQEFEINTMSARWTKCQMTVQDSLVLVSLINLSSVDWSSGKIKYNQNLTMIGPAGPPKMRSPYGFNSYRVLGYRGGGVGGQRFR